LEHNLTNKCCFKGAQAWDFRRRFFCSKSTHLVPWFII
jgi:hypothetical protein